MQQYLWNWVEQAVRRGEHLNVIWMWRSGFGQSALMVKRQQKQPNQGLRGTQIFLFHVTFAMTATGPRTSTVGVVMRPLNHLLQEHIPDFWTTTMSVKRKDDEVIQTGS
jgi:hypothetical protein